MGSLRHVATPSDLRRRAQALREQAEAIGVHAGLDRSVARAAEALRNEAERVSVMAQDLERLEAEAAEVLGVKPQRQRAARPVKGPRPMSTANPDYNRVAHAMQLGHARRKNPDHPVFRWLDAKRWSIAKLAEELGTKRSALGHYLSERNAWPSDVAERLRKLTGISPDKLGKTRP